MCNKSMDAWIPTFFKNDLHIEMSISQPLSVIVPLARVLTVDHAHLPTHFILHFGQRKRVGVGHHGTLFQSCGGENTPHGSY